jgi:hypothetical protein
MYNDVIARYLELVKTVDPKTALAEVIRDRKDWLPIVNALLPIINRSN